MELIVVEGDITQQQVDAVVNAANRHLRDGGGVTGAIFRAAGPALAADARRRYPDGLATGEAGWTTAGNMFADYVIHAVGPVFEGDADRDRHLLAACYANSLRIADELKVSTIAFPLISAGIYGWPREDAIRTAVRTLRETPTQVAQAWLVAFDRRAYDEIAAVLGR